MNPGASMASRALVYASLLTLACACRPAPAPAPAPAASSDEPIDRAISPLHPAAPLWGGLEPGPYAVGYEVRWLSDPARLAVTTDEGEPSRSPRPILWARWYPTRAPTGEALRRIDYARPAPDPDIPGTTSLAARLHDHLLGTMAEVVFRRPDVPGRDSWLMLSPEQRAQLEQLLSLPVPAYRDAPPAEGPFPALIYHTGAGGGLEDNAVLFEYLASHGYVVVSSAFTSDAHVDPNTGWADFTDSFADLQVLWRELSRRPEVDPAKIALLGHSLGAQTIYAYAIAHRGAAALVSLDTTFENVPLHERNSGTTDIYYDSPCSIDVPVANYYANVEPDLSFIESLECSDRDLVNIVGLGHEDFTSYGGALRARVEPEPDEPVAALYQAMCRDVRVFLDRSVLGGSREPEGDDAEPSVALERRHLPGDQGVGHSTRATVAALVQAGPEGLPAVLDAACEAEPQRCRGLLPDVLDELGFVGDEGLGEALVSHVVAPERRARLSSWRFEQSAGRIAMRRADWAGARRHFEHALVDLREHPLQRPHHQAHFERELTTQRDFASSQLEPGADESP